MYPTEDDNGGDSYERKTDTNSRFFQKQMPFDYRSEGNPWTKNSDKFMSSMHTTEKVLIKLLDISWSLLI